MRTFTLSPNTMTPSSLLFGPSELGWVPGEPLCLLVEDLDNFLIWPADQFDDPDSPQVSQDLHSSPTVHSLADHELSINQGFGLRKNLVQVHKKKKPRVLGPRANFKGQFLATLEHHHRGVH
jgi:hypothetical protein